MQKFSISICIPTRNRKDLLIECLDSILNQSVKPNEILIIDDSSNHETLNYINKLKPIYPFLRYKLQESKNGIAGAVIEAIKESNSDFCWMLSDDDLLEKNSLAKVLEFINENQNLSGLSVGYKFYDKTMSYRIKNMPPSRNIRLPNQVQFNSIESTFQEIGHHLGFLSGQIIKRKPSIDVINQNKLEKYMNSWIITNIIGLLLINNPKWAFLNLPLVKYRSGNDSFLERGIYKRQLITHEELRNTFLNFFDEESKTFKVLISTLVNNRMPRALAVIKANRASNTELFQIFKLYIKYYSTYLGFWIKVFPIFFVPGNLINLVRKLYNVYKKNR